ncbi:MAG: CheR family methyltransferase, partial [Thermodesulfobacteriota bacterium]|nr:CheR family methyltransferase [Thermodesulfobacteriota bacterium]
RMLAVAKRAIYSNNDIKPIPAKLRQKYLLRGTGSQRSFFRIVPELRNRIKFQQLNLTDRSFGIRIPIHILFCRNVIIYFDRKTQIELFKKFYNQLIPGGYLFIGHSETLYGINGQFHQVATTIYRRP